MVELNRALFEYTLELPLIHTLMTTAAKQGASLTTKSNFRFQCPAQWHTHMDWGMD